MITRAFVRAFTECTEFGGTTAAVPALATAVSPSIVISSVPSTMCHTSSSSCECAWIDAPASTS
jgi:hypothetical protein